MQVTKIVCDRSGCKQENAYGFKIFKERKADNAGGMENWYYRFDICPSCTVLFLDNILEKAHLTHISIAEHLGIVWRPE